MTKPRYTKGRELPTTPGDGRKWIIVERGVHEQYYPIVRINSGSAEKDERWIDQAIDAWNKGEPTLP